MERFKPSKGQTYWFVGTLDSSEPMALPWVCGDRPSFDEFCYQLGNCFATKEQAEAHRDMLMRIAAGRAVVVNVPEGWEVDHMVGCDFSLSITPQKTIHFKRTPPPPPKEIVVKVYDVEVHGDPIHGRLYVYVGKGLYIYPNEAEGL